MAEPLAKRARAEPSPLLTELPPELDKHVYGFLDFHDHQRLRKTNKALNAHTPLVAADGGFHSANERKALETLAKRLETSPQTILPALLDRLKNTTYPNRSMVGVALNIDYFATREALKRSVRYKIDQLARTMDKNAALAKVVLSVVDAVLLPVLQVNAPNVYDYKTTKANSIPNPSLRRRFLSAYGQNGHETFDVGFGSLDFEASDTTRSMRIRTAANSVTFWGDHPEPFEPHAGGWGLAHRLKEMTECSNWRRTGTLNNDAELIAFLILKSGMFYDKNPNSPMFIRAGFADACAAGC